MALDSSRFRRLLAIGRAVFGPLALLFLLLAAWNARSLAAELVSQANLLALALLAVGWALLNTLTPLAATLVLRGLGVEITYATAARIHLQRLPARYLPGGIWHTVSRLVDFRQLGVTNTQLSTLVLVENVVPLATAVALGAALAAFSPGNPVPVPALLAVALALLLAVPLLLRQRLFLGEAPLALAAYLGATAVFVLFWILAASLFSAYWSALPLPVAGQGGLAPAMVYLLAWAAGFVAVLAPQGIGVFEAAAGWMLKGNAPLSTMAFLVAGYRLVTLAGDLVAYAALRLFQRAGVARTGLG